MRILHLVSSLDGGGAEKQLAHLASGLTALGCEVHVAYQLDGDLRARFQHSGSVLHHLGWSAAWDPRVVASVARLVRRTRADVVQTWLRRMDVAGGIAAILAGRPWVYSERTAWQDGGARQALRKLLIKRNASIIANSGHAAAPWRAEVGPARVHVIPNALPLDAISAAPPASRVALGVPEDAELVVAVGRFHEAKSPLVLAEAIARVLAARPRAHALVCGKGDLAAAFRAAVDAAGPSVSARCHTPGFREDVYSILKTATVFVQCSRFEGSPNSVLEAMACGAPLVLSDMAGHREAAREAEAHFFPIASPAAAAEACAAAIARTLDDPAAARARAALARARVQSFSEVELARAHLAVYRRLAGEPGTRAARAALG